MPLVLKLLFPCLKATGKLLGPSLGNFGLNPGLFASLDFFPESDSPMRPMHDFRCESVMNGLNCFFNSLVASGSDFFEMFRDKGGRREFNSP